MTDKGKIVSPPAFERTIIRNRRQMTYDEAQEIIEISTLTPEDEIAKDVRLLYKLSQALKEGRLGKKL